MSGPNIIDRRKFSLTIDKILKDCQKLQSPNKKAFSKNVESQISQFSSAFEQLSTTDLDPITFQASRAYHNGKERITAYLEDKSRPGHSLNLENLQKILNEESPKLKKLTFKSLEQEDISFLFSKNKRKFGETYKSKGFSAKVSPESSNLPSIITSPKVSPEGDMNERRLNGIINSMIKKKLGILPKDKKNVERKKTFRRNNKKRVSIKTKFPFFHTEKNEAVYLNPDFSMYNSNLENKLKVERMVVKQHAKERRASMVLTQILKTDDGPVSPYLE
jgi:hypothetical protein